MKKIILEGITGSGKSSNIGYMKDYFQSHGKSVSIADSHAPVYEMTKDVRKYLKDNNEPLMAQLLLHQSTTYMKLFEVETSDILIMDRFVLSDLVYTFAKAELTGINIDYEKSRAGVLHPLGLDPLIGSSTIYFDIDIGEAKKRTKKRTKKTVEGFVRNNFSDELQGAARKYFDQEFLLLEYSKFRIDANRNPDEVKSQLELILDLHLE